MKRKISVSVITPDGKARIVDLVYDDHEIISMSYTGGPLDDGDRDRLLNQVAALLPKPPVD